MSPWRSLKCAAPACLLVALGLGLLACSKKEKVVWVNQLDPAIKHAEHFVLESQALGHGVGVSVHLPSDYISSTKRYPVIYFLHGVGGDETSDIEGFMSFLQPLIERYALPEPIVVFPNGGSSQYQGQVEPMIIEELIPYIDNRYRTIAQTESRIATGFSMGGAGAVRLAIRYPNVFGGAASWAGGMWHKDHVLFEAAATNAPILKANGFHALMINGEQDRPTVFARLEDVLDEHSVDNKRVVLDGVNHDFSLYLERSDDLFGEFLSAVLNDSERSAGINE